MTFILCFFHHHLHMNEWLEFDNEILWIEWMWDNRDGWNFIWYFVMMTKTQANEHSMRREFSKENTSQQCNNNHRIYSKAIESQSEPVFFSFLSLSAVVRLKSLKSMIIWIMSLSIRQSSLTWIIKFLPNWASEWVKSVREKV